MIGVRVRARSGDDVVRGVAVVGRLPQVHRHRNVNMFKKWASLIRVRTGTKSCVVETEAGMIGVGAETGTIQVWAGTESGIDGSL